MIKKKVLITDRQVLRQPKSIFECMLWVSAIITLRLRQKSVTMCTIYYFLNHIHWMDKMFPCNMYKCQLGLFT